MPDCPRSCRLVSLVGKRKGKQRLHRFKSASRMFKEDSASLKGIASSTQGTPFAEPIANSETERRKDSERTMIKRTIKK